MALVFTWEKLQRIYDRTDGRCHICSRQVVWKNYGALGARGAWEVDHSVPRAAGGTDRLSNLLPAHTRCNRAKQASSSQSARSQYGRRRAPLSAERRRAARVGNGIIGVGLGWTIATLVAPQARVPAMVLGAATGLCLDPDEL
jgi:5-methylcytosine-specific restriction endonuclease McrA